MTETTLSVKVALNMLSSVKPAAPRADWAGAADAVSAPANKTAAMAAAPRMPALADGARAAKQAQPQADGACRLAACGNRARPAA